MNKYLKVFWIVGVLMILTYSQGFAQAINPAGRNYLRIGVNPVIGSKANVNENLKTEVGFGLGARLEIGITTRFAIVPEFIHYFPNTLDLESIGEFKITIQQFNINTNLYFENTPAYLILGLSYTYAEATGVIFDIEVLEDIDEYGANAGFGITNSSRRFAAEVKYDSAFEQLAFSLVFYFTRF